MKNKIFNSLLVGTILFTISTCRTDNQDNQDSQNSENTSVVGTWKLQKKQTISGEDSKTILEEVTPKSDCEKKSTYGFSADSKFTYTNYYLKNNVCTLESTESTGYKYDKKTKKINIGRHTGEVIELTTKTLVVSFTESDYNKDGKKDIDQSYYTK